ncbi:MAG: nitronate monooxygenase [Planctomycetota bacterium]|jgi:nitronate monooxygenase|nr:nitronate monooxygenase [Planctomycetota bacterium]MDP6940039.1 nitronate monooxygenase [Planctomycetota bacterium]
MTAKDPPPIKTTFTLQAGIDYPIICGAMYPCSNPELVAAVSEAGGIGIVQPISLTYVHGREFRAGLREIKDLTNKPIGLNAIVEKSVKRYEDRMREWIDISLEEGVRFFVTALGNPRWVVDAVHACGGIVYHDVTERRWAEKALQEGVDGLICVNRRAGGHAGDRSPEELHEELADLGVPLVLAGGVGDGTQFKAALDMGYDGVQMGTRFIATTECEVHADYHRAIIDADEEDIVLTDKLSGVPCSVIKTPLVERLGTSAGPLASWLLRHPRTKHWMRTFYTLRSLRRLKRSSQRGLSYRDVFQAGKSAGTIHRVEPAGEVVRRFVRTARGLE